MLKPRYKHQYKFSKIDKEKATVAYMISFYCRHQHTPNTLCIDCKELINYSQLRLEKCRYGNNKTACKACLTHCYNPVMRQKIKEVMRYAGPRMIFYAPISSLMHFFNSK